MPATAAQAATLTAALWAAAPAAHAQAEDQAAARALFDEGRRLLKARKYEEACAKLEAARQLYTSAGILLNLADCQEKIGRTASAWTGFGEAATVATRTGRPDDAHEARRRQAALESSLTRIVIRVDHPVPGLLVKRDGAVLVAAAWGSPLPVDPGPHSVRAEAPGYEPWTGSVTVSTPRQVEIVEIPELRATATAPPPLALKPGPERGPEPTPAIKTAKPVEADRGPEATVATAPKPGRALPLALIGAGAAAAVGGGVLMLVESSRASTAREKHDPAAYDATRTPWTIGLVAVIAGVVSAGAGATLLAIAPAETKSAPVNVSAWLDGRTGGVVLAKRW